MWSYHYCYYYFEKKKWNPLFIYFKIKFHVSIILYLWIDYNLTQFCYIYIYSAFFNKGFHTSTKVLKSVGWICKESSFWFRFIWRLKLVICTLDNLLILDLWNQTFVCWILMNWGLRWRHSCLQVPGFKGSFLILL